jgi:hypothetical protein
VRPLLVAVACVLAGLAAGAIWTVVQPDRYRADARVLLRPASSRVVPAIEALAESSLVESNVAQTLHLSSPPHLSAKRGDGGVLTVSVEAGSRERARQIDAEAVVVLTQTVAQRFGKTPRVTVTVLDPAHAAERTSPTPERNLLVTGLIGLVAGLAAAALGTQRATRVAGSVDPRVERRLRTRIDEVTKRERALAKRAGELAAREQRLGQREEELAAAASRPSPSEHAVDRDRREQELAQQRQREAEQRLAEQQRRLEQRDAELKARQAELEAAAAEAARAQATPPPAPEPVTPSAEPAGARGQWNLAELEARVNERGGNYPDQIDEWRSYLFFLREHSDIDGNLPSNFDSLVGAVFERLLRA